MTRVRMVDIIKPTRRQEDVILQRQNKEAEEKAKQKEIAKREQAKKETKAKLEDVLATFGRSMSMNPPRIFGISKNNKAASRRRASSEARSRSSKQTRRSASRATRQNSPRLMASGLTEEEEVEIRANRHQQM